jgi:hypothetical protein
VVAPPHGRRVAVAPVGERVEQLAGVAVAADPAYLLPQRVLRPLGGAEVAQVLVDPVRREPADDPVVPPRQPRHLLAPGTRGVPVVADVVVIEDHRAWQCGQQPAVGGVGPGQPVQMGVLLVVAQLLLRRLREVAACGDELPHLLRRLVGVDLVAQEHHQVGPLLVGHVVELQRVRPQHVDAVAAVVLGVVRDAGAARPEQHPVTPAGRQRTDPARWVPRALRRPDHLAVDPHVVRRGGARLEPVDLHQGVVVAVHGERRHLVAAPGDLDGDGPAARHLHPHRGRGLIDVTQHGSEHQSVLHALSSTPRRRFYPLPRRLRRHLAAGVRAIWPRWIRQITCMAHATDACWRHAPHPASVPRTRLASDARLPRGGRAAADHAGRQADAAALPR